MALPPDRRNDLQSGVQGSVRSRRPSALGVRPLPGSARARDRFTARSPSSGVGDYFRFLLHRGVSQPPDPDLDRVWAIVPVTVSRASSAASGRCRPALTGVGAVPCDQSRAVTASCRRRITPPSASAASSPITARRAGVVAEDEGADLEPDATISELLLVAVGHVPWWPPETNEVTLHHILVRVATDTGRHAGHGDILRELGTAPTAWLPTARRARSRRGR
jgi:hypothetical protein